MNQSPPKGEKKQCSCTKKNPSCPFDPSFPPLDPEDVSFRVPIGAPLPTRNPAQLSFQVWRKGVLSSFRIIKSTGVCFCLIVCLCLFFFRCFAPFLFLEKEIVSRYPTHVSFLYVLHVSATQENKRRPTNLSVALKRFTRSRRCGRGERRGGGARRRAWRPPPRG